MNSFVEQCGPGTNPLMNYVGTFTGNKSNWQDQFHAGEGPGQRPGQMPPHQQHRRQEKQMMKEYFNPQEFQRFGEPDQMSLRDTGRTIGPNNQISPLIPERPFQNFLGGFQDNTLPVTNGPSHYQINVSPDQKERISSRSHVLSKHLSEDAEFAENQVDGLLSSLSIDHNPQYCGHQGFNHSHSIETKHAEWIEDYSAHHRPQTASKWSNSFLEDENNFVSQRPVPSKPWADDFQKQSNKPGWASQFDEEKKAWADDFKEREEVGIDEVKQLRDQIMKNGDEKLNNSSFMNFYNAYADGQTQQNADGEVITTKNNKTQQGENSMINEFLDQQQARGGFANEFVNQNPGAAWAEDYSQKSRGNQGWVDDFHKEKSFAEEYNEEYEQTEKEWQEKWERIRSTTGEWAENYLNWGGEGERDMIEAYEREFNKFGDSDVYVFQVNNPFLADPQALEKGIDFFNEGRLNECILALEATVQQDPTNSNAWTQLGKAHAENDKDKLAILALEQAVAVDHGNLDALMALAVSLTNEYEPDKTGEALKHWLLENPKYANIPDRIKPSPHETATQLAQKMFLEAVRQEPTVDSEVHIALGLLYNLSFEYEKATQCFKVALVQRPDDYALWNKYGATIANSPEGRTSVDIAIDAYFHALEQKPSFTRARSNLGISYMSAKNYVESAKCFLGALSINNSPHLWDSARSSFLQMGRTDLAEKCSLGDVRLFRNEFDF